VQSKNRFENGSGQLDVKIKSFCADNAPFNTTEFKSDLENKGQNITFSGVGARHNNGVAERSTKTITAWSHTMMLHTILHWPEQTTLDMWPFATEHMVYCSNHLPRKKYRIAPLEAFTGTIFSNYDHFKCLHIWGSPYYVLPKWVPCCRQGQYLGVSLDHSMIARIINTRIGRSIIYYMTIHSILWFRLEYHVHILCHYSGILCYKHGMNVISNWIFIVLDNLR
jgi:hypothetical protein